MFTDRARALTQGIVNPIAHTLGRFGLTPNLLTVAGTLFHVVVMALLAMGQFVAGGLLLFVAAGIDGLDGTLARQTGRVSAFGGFLDSTFDRISEIITFAGLILYLEWTAPSSGAAAPAFSATLVFAAATGSIMTSYSRARSESIGKSTKVGFLGRMERMFLLFLGLVTSGLVASSVTLVLWIIAIGAWVTTAWRIYDVWRQCAGEAAGEGKPA